MIQHAFGERAPFTLGVEEELMILDADTLDQVAAVDRIVAASGRATCPASRRRSSSRRSSS